MGAVNVRVRSDDIALERLDIVRLTSRNAASTALPGVTGAAWRFRLGAERLTHDPDDNAVGLIEGGFGRAAASERLTVYGLATGRFNVPAERTALAEAGATVGAVFRGRGWRAAFESILLVPLTGAGGLRDVHVVEARLGNSRRWEVRLRAEYRDSLETGFQVARFW
jgi:hypothetical protein